MSSKTSEYIFEFQMPYRQNQNMLLNANYVISIGNSISAVVQEVYVIIKNRWFLGDQTPNLLR